MYVLMHICDIIAFIYSFICQDFVAREINQSEGILDASTRKCLMNTYLQTIFLFMPSEKITNVSIGLAEAVPLPS